MKKTINTTKYYKQFMGLPEEAEFILIFKNVYKNKKDIRKIKKIEKLIELGFEKNSGERAQEVYVVRINFQELISIFK